ncbi:hypothetical protein K2X85_19670 [bacterium]|nr:hypothetical protein [bacterium]
MFTNLKTLAVVLGMMMVSTTSVWAGHRPVTSEGKAWNHTIHRPQMRMVRSNRMPMRSAAIVARPSSRVIYSPAYQGGR